MNGTERKSKRQRNGESKLAQKKHRLHRKESKYKDWRLDGLEDPLLCREHRSRDPAELAAESAHQTVTLTEGATLPRRGFRRTFSIDWRPS